MFKQVLISLFASVILGQSMTTSGNDLRPDNQNMTTAGNDLRPDNQNMTTAGNDNQDITFNNTDWFGALVNPECQPVCKWSFCDSPGEVCSVYICVNPCNQDTTCEQSYMKNSDTELLTFDCSTGIVEITPNCTTPACTYTDCAEEDSNDVCWVEECTDQCELYNCTIWYQQEEEWYGEACEDESWMPNFRFQDVVQSSQNFAATYENSFNKMLDQVCEANNTDCQNGKKDYNDFVTGTVPQQEKVKGTEQISQMGNAAAVQALGGLNMFVANQLSNYTDVLFSAPVKEMIASVVNDTNTADQDPNGDQIDLQAYEQVSSTEQVLQAAESQVTLENLLNVAGAYISSGDDEETQSWWSMFTMGLENNGQERKGSRDGGQ